MASTWNRIVEGPEIKSLVSFSGRCPVVCVNFSTGKVVYRADNGRSPSEAVVLDGVNLENVKKAFLAINKTMPSAGDRNWLVQRDE